MASSSTPSRRLCRTTAILVYDVPKKPVQKGKKPLQTPRHILGTPRCSLKGILRFPDPRGFMEVPPRPPFLRTFLFSSFVYLEKAMGKKGGGKGGASSSEDSGDRLDRIAIVNSDRCRPKKCRHECKRSCPVVKVGKLCIEVSPASKVAWISEDLCIGTSFHSYLWWFF